MRPLKTLYIIAIVFIYQSSIAEALPERLTIVQRSCKCHIVVSFDWE